MILSEEQIALAVHGWVDKEKKGDYLVFYRFTKAQRNYYSQTHFTPKERASSGLYLEFTTDASAVKFDYIENKASSQDFYFFDLYVNGKMISHVGKEKYEKMDEGVYEQLLPTGEKTVRIYFPNLSKTSIRNVELKEASTFRPTEKKIKYIAYGDSITQGYTALSPSLTYVNLVGMELDADAYDLGIGGEFFQPLMIDENYPVKADIVTVAYGTNDWGHVLPEEDAERRKGFFERLLRAHPEAKIFVILPIWRGTQNDQRNGYGTLEDYRNLLREEAKQFPRITVIEGENLVPHHGDFFMPDLLHPNALGFTQYAKNLWNEIKKHL